MKKKKALRLLMIHKNLYFEEKKLLDIYQKKVKELEDIIRKFHKDSRLTSDEIRELKTLVPPLVTAEDIAAGTVRADKVCTFIPDPRTLSIAENAGRNIAEAIKRANKDASGRHS